MAAVPVGKPPMTHSHTLPTAGEAVEFTFDEKTNRYSIKPIGNPVRFAFNGSEGNPVGAAGSGDDAGIDVAAGELVEVTVSVGTDRVKRLDLFVEPSVDATELQIVAEE